MMHSSPNKETTDNKAGCQSGAEWAGKRLRGRWMEPAVKIQIPTLDLNVWVEAGSGLIIEMQTIPLAALYTNG